MRLSAVLNQIFRPSATAAVSNLVDHSVKARNACRLLLDQIENSPAHGTGYLSNPGLKAYANLESFKRNEGRITPTDAKAVWADLRTLKHDFQGQLRSVLAIRGHGPSANTDICAKLKSNIDEIRAFQRSLAQPNQR